MPQIPLLMPPLGESIAEAAVVRIAVQAGERVCADQDVMEVETSKAAMAITAPQPGRIGCILAEPGQSYPVGTVLGYLETAAPLLVWSTFPDAETARKAAQTLVEERLAACANLLPGVESVYRWKGKVETAAEVWAIFKTTEENYPKLEARLQALHPYELPEIVAQRLECGLPGYLQWIEENC